MVTIASEKDLATKGDIDQINQKCAEHSTNNKLMSKDIKDIKEDIKDIKDTLKGLSDVFVTKLEFTPVKAIAYGFVGAVTLAFLGGLMALIWKV